MATAKRTVKVTVHTDGAASFDGHREWPEDLPQAAKEWRETGFNFTFEKACHLVRTAQVDHVKALLGVRS